MMDEVKSKILIDAERRAFRMWKAALKLPMASIDESKLIWHAPTEAQQLADIEERARLQRIDSILAKQ